MKRVVLIAAMIAAFGLGAAAAFAGTSDKPPSPPGQPECEHGNSQKPCKDDPQPEHGQECEEHGKNGGQNEDHCKSETTPTDTTPTETTPTETTPTETTPTETTPTTSTPAETTPTEPSSNGTPSDQAPPEESVPTEPAPSDSTPPASDQVFAPPAAQAQAKGAPEPVAAVSATQPTTDPQLPPFTP